MKSTFKKIGYFLKKHIFSVICLLLATIICISGTLSYSKYIVNDGSSNSATAGSFNASAYINGISALSFTNTAFWGGTESSDKIAMNALRQIKFSVNNYQTDNSNNQKVADVRMRYNLVFSAPVNFAEKLAFQVFDDKDVALFPQIVIADLLAKKSGEQYDTSTSVDYNGQAIGDLTFTVTNATIDGMTTVTAVSSNGVSVTFTKFTKEVDQTLLFRLWDVSSLTSDGNPTVSNEGGKIKPPVTVNYKQDVEFYKISVTMPSFVLPASIATTINHSIQLAPTSAIDDDYLGGALMHVTTDTSNNKIYTSVNPTLDKVDKSIYGPSETGNEFAIETLVESTVDTFYNDSSLTGTAVKTESSTSKVFGNVLSYKDGETTSSTFSTQTSKDLQLSPSESTSGSVGEATTTTSFLWNNYQLTDRAKEYDEYLLDPDDKTATTKSYSHYKDTTTVYLDDDNNVAGKFVDVGTAGSYGTAFYIHKLAATQTGVKTVSTVTSRELVSKTQVTDTEVREEMTCTKIDGNKISLKVTKTTDIKVSENKVYRVISSQIKSTVTRTGYIYRAYYLESNSGKPVCISRGGSYDTFKQAKTQSNNPNEVSSSNPSITYQNQVMFYETTSGTNTVCNYFGDDQYSTETNVQTLTDTSNILESTKISDDTKTEYIKREITRDYSYKDIVITEISVSESTLEETTTSTHKTVYTSDNPLKMYDEVNNQQKYYLSTSYSKNYPFYVDVIFEQVLN